MKLCTKCGLNPQTKTNPWCRPCNATNQRDYVKRCIESGLCFECGKNPHVKNRRSCQNCSTKRQAKRKDIYAFNKAKAIEYLGGKCIDCGLETDQHVVYDFDHKERELKTTEIGRLLRRLWEHIQPELDKCELRCSNCHRIKTFNKGWPTRWETVGV